MSACLAQMTQAAATDRLLKLAAALTAAAEAGDLEQVRHLDLAIRSAAMAVLGSRDDHSETADTMFEALQTALDAVVGASRVLNRRAKGTAKEAGARRIYLAYTKERR